MQDTPLDEKALETRREEIVALFQARIARWQHVQTAAFAVATIALAAFLGGAMKFPMFLRPSSSPRWRWPSLQGSRAATRNASVWR